MPIPAILLLPTRAATGCFSVVTPKSSSEVKVVLSVNESGRPRRRDCTFANTGGASALPVRRLDRSHAGAPPAPRCVPASLAHFARRTTMGVLGCVQSPLVQPTLCDVRHLSRLSRASLLTATWSIKRPSVLRSSQACTLCSARLATSGDRPLLCFHTTDDGLPAAQPSYPGASLPGPAPTPTDWTLQ